MPPPLRRNALDLNAYPTSTSSDLNIPSASRPTATSMRRRFTPGMPPPLIFAHPRYPTPEPSLDDNVITSTAPASHHQSLISSTQPPPSSPHSCHVTQLPLLPLPLCHDDHDATSSSPLQSPPPCSMTMPTPHRPGPLSVSPSQCPSPMAQRPTPPASPTTPPPILTTTMLIIAPSAHNYDYNTSANTNAHNEDEDSA
ncbi:hypothetical protein BDQ17DRAFT_1369798 [Cyathus striatus]|nr:hypothetical protein BDQ17DRAFT_1369798 [Cyathus striatus]